jgi:hypothetical protein
MATTSDLTMSAEIDVAKHRLFDREGLAAMNVKLYPGEKRESTAEQMAEALNKALAQIDAGDYEDISDLD